MPNIRMVETREKSKHKKVKPAKKKFKLPVEWAEPSGTLWSFSYLIVGDKKVGKTTFAQEGADFFTLQFDAPQIAYRRREVCPKNWSEFRSWLKALEIAAEADRFPYNRVIVDGVSEWYQLCQGWVCEKLAIQHPSEAGYSRGWHMLRDEFTDAVNRLLRLQSTAKCGLLFIAHSEWKETKLRGGVTIEKLVPALPARAEEILGGKVDGWFTYTYQKKKRVLYLQGDEEMAGGHRIDGHFLTPAGEPISEIPMGSSAAQALRNFSAAFDNTWKYQTLAEWRTARENRANRVAPGDIPGKLRAKAR